MSLGPNLFLETDNEHGFEVDTGYWDFRSDSSRKNDASMTNKIGSWYLDISAVGSPELTLILSGASPFSLGVLYQFDCVIHASEGTVFIELGGGLSGDHSIGGITNFSFQDSFAGDNIFKVYAAGAGGSHCYIDQLQMREVLPPPKIGGSLVNGILVNRGLVT